MDAHELVAPAVSSHDSAQQLYLDAQPPGSGRPSTSAPRSSVSTARSRISNNSDSHGSGRGSHDSKPRLSKEQHETLEAHYQCEPKPSTQTKKEFSTRLGVSVEKVNNWFQNRRAKTKHELKKQREQQNQVFSGAEQFSSNEQFGHPLADNHLIDEAFYQTIGGAPDPAAMQQQFRRPDHSIADTPGFSNFPTIPEEPAVIGEDPGFYNFFGLPDGDQQKVDMSTVAAIRKQFNPPSLEGFDPAAMLRQAQEAYNNGNSVAAMSSNDLSSAHMSQDYSVAGSLPGPYESRRPSSSMVSMTTAPTATSRTSSTSWNQQQQEHFFNNMTGQTFQAFGPSYGGYFPPESMSHSFSAPSVNHMRQQSMVYSPTDQSDTNMAFDNANIAMPQPVLPSQTIAGQQPSEQPQRTPMDAAPSSVALELGHSAPMSSQLPSRCDSGTSMLADSLDQIDVQTGPGAMPHLKHSHSSATLATRRQRRPPPGLGPAALRSQSYNNGPPSATEQGSFGSAAEYPLRRIKSSTVMGGRIQKQGSSVSQRSPFSLAFSDAAQRSPAPFTPGEQSSAFNWNQQQQAPPMQTPHPAQMQLQMQMQNPQFSQPPQHFYQQQTPLPLQMAQQLHGTQPVPMDMSGSPEQHFPHPQHGAPIGPTYPPTPHDSQSSMTPPQMQQKHTPELQFQSYQPREPVDPASLPPKSKSAAPRGSYQFQNFNQNNFTSPRGSSVKSSDTP